MLMINVAYPDDTKGQSNTAELENRNVGIIDVKDRCVCSLVRQYKTKAGIHTGLDMNLKESSPCRKAFFSLGGKTAVCGNETNNLAYHYRKVDDQG